jgi:phosphate/sulfate permease
VLISVLLVVGLGTAAAMPISSGHAVAGSLVGVALLSGGPKGVSWIVLREIVSAWVVSLLLGTGVAFAIRYVLRVAGSSYARYKVVLPVLAGICACGMLGVVLAVGTFRSVTPLAALHVAALEFVTFAGACAVASAFIRRNAGTSVSSVPVYVVAEDEEDDIEAGDGEGATLQPKVHGPQSGADMFVVDAVLLSGDPTDGDVDANDEDDVWAGSFVLDEQAPIFRLLLMVTSAAVAFAHGNSDVSGGAAGTFHSIVLYYRAARSLDKTANSGIDGAFTLLMRVAGASSMALGLALCGNGVIETVGSGIHRNRMTYARGFSAQFSAAAAVICAKAVGLPISTSHSLIAAIGVSNVAYVPPTERARDGIQWHTLQRIAELAVLTPIVSAFAAVAIRLFLRLLFG